MNLGGLHNLGPSLSPKPAGQTKPSSNKEAGSFEKILGKAQSPIATKAPNKVANKAEENPRKEDDSQPSTEQNSSSKEPLTAKAEAVDAKGAAGKAEPAQKAADAPEKVGKVENSEAPAAKAEDAPTQNPQAMAAGVAVPGMAERPAVAQPTSAIFNAQAVAARTMSTSNEDEATGAVSHRGVWNEFLRKMKGLGVSADDVAQAFGSLSKEDMAQPPEKNIDKMVMALGLDGHQAMLAKQYFHELVQKTDTKSLGEDFAASKKSLAPVVLAEANKAPKTAPRTVEPKNFFMHKPMPAEQRVETAAPAPTDEAPVESAELGAASVAAAKGEDAKPALANSAPRANAPRNEELNKLVSQLKTDKAPDKKSIDDLLKEFNPSAVPAAANAPAPRASAMNERAAQMAGMMPMPAAKASEGSVAPAKSAAPMNTGSSMGLGGFFVKENAQDNSSDKKGDDSSSSAFANSAALGDNRLASTLGPKGEFQAQLAQATPGQPMTVPDAVQQAHVMVREGGGDMKVTLHPEGLGEVAMRVSVDDGKVSVQMITESDEAKKLIERQIGDLKSGLTANHLQVESIKVDTASNLGRQLEQQYQDAHRQQAQASMEQFRQDHQGWRRSFFETGSVNPYLGQGEGPRGAAVASARSVSNRRLDLVA